MTCAPSRYDLPDDRIDDYIDTDTSPTIRVFTTLSAAQRCYDRVVKDGEVGMQYKLLSCPLDSDDTFNGTIESMYKSEEIEEESEEESKEEDSDEEEEEEESEEESEEETEEIKIAGEETDKSEGI